MKIGIGEKKIFEVEKNTMSREQFDLLANTCGKFNAENGTGLVEFKNGTKVLFLKDEDTGLTVAYAFKKGEYEYKGPRAGTAKLLTDIEVKNGKIVLHRAGKGGSTSEIDGDEFAKLAEEAKDKKTAFENASKNLQTLEEELNKITELQEPAKKLYSELLEVSDKKLTAEKKLGKEKNPEDGSARFNTIQAQKALDEATEKRKKDLLLKDVAETNFKEAQDKLTEASKTGTSAEVFKLAKEAYEAAKQEYDNAVIALAASDKAKMQAEKDLADAQAAEKKAEKQLDDANAAYNAVVKKVDEMNASNPYTAKYFDGNTTTDARETYFKDLVNAKTNEIAAATDVKNEAQKAYGATFIGAVENIVAQPKFKALRRVLAGDGFIQGIYPAPIKEGGYLVVLPTTSVWGRGKHSEPIVNQICTIYTKNLDEEQIAKLKLCEKPEEVGEIVPDFQFVYRLITTKDGSDSGIVVYKDPTRDKNGHYVSNELQVYELEKKNKNAMNDTIDKIRYNYEECHTDYREFLYENVDKKESYIHQKGVKKVRGTTLIILGAAAVIAGGFFGGMYLANKENTILGLQEDYETSERHQFIMGAENKGEEATKLGTNQKNELNLLDGSKNGEANIKVLHFEDLPAYDQPNPVKCTNPSTGEVKYLELTPEEKQQVAMNYNYDEAQFGKGLSYTLGYSFAGDLAKEAASNENIRLGTYSQESGEWTYTTKYVDMVADMYKNEPRFYANYFAEGYMEGVKTLDKTTAAGFPDPNFDITQAAEDLGYDKVLGGEGDTFYTLEDTTLTKYTEDPEYKLADAMSTADLEKVIGHATLVREYEEMSAEYGKAYENVYMAETERVSDNALHVYYVDTITGEAREGDSVSVRTKGSSNNEKLMTAMGFVYDDGTKEAYEYTWDCSKFGNESTVKVCADLDAYNASPYAAGAELGN